MSRVEITDLAVPTELSREEQQDVGGGWSDPYLLYNAGLDGSPDILGRRGSRRRPRAAEQRGPVDGPERDHRRPDRAVTAGNPGTIRSQQDRIIISDREHQDATHCDPRPPPEADLTRQEQQETVGGYVGYILP